MCFRLQNAYKVARNFSTKSPFHDENSLTSTTSVGELFLYKTTLTMIYKISDGKLIT